MMDLTLDPLQWRPENLPHVRALMQTVERATSVTHWHATQTASGLHIQFGFSMRTLVRKPYHPVALGGPVDVDLRIESAIRTPAAPTKVAARLHAPWPVFHPAVSIVGTPCLGILDRALQAGLELDVAAVVFLLWDGLHYFPGAFTLDTGTAMNPNAQQFALQNATQLPLDSTPLFFAEPALRLDEEPIIPLDARWLPAEQLPGDVHWQRIHQQRIEAKEQAKQNEDEAMHDDEDRA